MAVNGGWGWDAWGSSPWGGGEGGGAFEVAAVHAWRENVLRVAFTAPVYASGIFDDGDALAVRYWHVTAVEGSAGADGEPVRPVRVVEVRKADDDIPPGGAGFFVDVVLDRPMSSWPALYDLAVEGVSPAGDPLETIDPAVIRVMAVYRVTEPPRVDGKIPSRDFANSQTREAARDARLIDPDNPLALGTIRVDASGDYAIDEGETNLRKRVLRRVFTRKNGYAHLPGYGVGLLDYGKRLGIPSVLVSVAADAESQILEEPDVAQVRCRPLIDPNTPGLVRLLLAVKPRAGVAFRIEVPVPL